MKKSGCTTLGYFVTQAFLRICYDNCATLFICHLHAFDLLHFFDFPLQEKNSSLILLVSFVTFGISKVLRESELSCAVELKIQLM